MIVRWSQLLRGIRSFFIHFKIYIWLTVFNLHLLLQCPQFEISVIYFKATFCKILAIIVWNIKEADIPVMKGIHSSWDIEVYMLLENGGKKFLSSSISQLKNKIKRDLKHKSWTCCLERVSLNEFPHLLVFCQSSVFLLLITCVFALVEPKKLHLYPVLVFCPVGSTWPWPGVPLRSEQTVRTAPAGGYHVDSSA